MARNSREGTRVTKRLMHALALFMSAALIGIGCGGDDDETTDATTGATAETGAVGAVGETLDVGDTTFTIADVSVEGNLVTVGLEASGGGEIVTPDNPLGATLIGGDGKEYKGQANLSTSGLLVWEFDVPPEAQSGATLELDQGGTTDSIDLGIE